jgi:hypothetical protein
MPGSEWPGLRCAANEYMEDTYVPVHVNRTSVFTLVLRFQ